MPLAQGDGSTYGQILKSSALIGGSSVLNLAIGMVRTKAMAVMLGPAGIGLIGILSSIVDLAVTVVGMGINSSGVRQIAESVGTGDADRIARTVAVLRRTSVLLGVLGAVLLAVFARQISSLTFGTDSYRGAIAFLSLAVLFRSVSAAQGALIQGMRRIGDLALSGSLGALFGSIASVLLVYLLGERGVMPSIIAGAGVGLVLSWYFSRRVTVRSVGMPSALVRREARGLLALGLVFMVSALVQIGGSYVVRAMVLRMHGMEAAGLYQAAWTLGGLYVGVVLGAMAADFFPRLVSAITDANRCNRLVNEQAQISLLLAGPGVIATITLSYLVMRVFYSSEFLGAVEVLRWFCLGMALRIISWPLGFVIAAQGRKGILLGTEVAWSVVNIGLSWVCLREFGLKGAGIAFFASYVFHVAMIYPIVQRLSGFTWSAENLRAGAFFLSSISVVFCGFLLLTPFWAIVVGLVALLVSIVHSIRALLRFIPLERVPLPMRQLLIRWNFVPPSFFG